MSGALTSEYVVVDGDTNATRVRAPLSHQSEGLSSYRLLCLILSRLFVRLLRFHSGICHVLVLTLASTAIATGTEDKSCLLFQKRNLILSQRASTIRLLPAVFVSLLREPLVGLGAFLGLSCSP